MSMIINLHKHSFCQRAAILLILCALAGCETFLVSVCEFEDRPTCAEESSSNVDLPQKADDGPAIAIQERKFERRASFSFHDCQKFNGIIDKKILTLSRSNCTSTPSSPAWEAWNIDLDNSNLKYFSRASVENYPMVPSGFDFSKDEIYTTGRKFYYLQYSGYQQLFELNGINKNQIVAVKLTNSSKPRAFAHPSLDVFAVLGASSVTYLNPIFINSRQSSCLFGSSITPTNFVVGDLDGNDLMSNGEEIVSFEGKTPITVRHCDLDQDPLTADQDLLNSIKLSIDRASPGNVSDIEAAFIININNDQFPDLIYSRSGQIYVTSYLGHNNSIKSRFKEWSANIARISNETIKSLVAVELTGDAYPELVVETDKAVRFYVNTPK